jgi:hypothetical protein
VGFIATLASVIGLTRFAEPQHHHATVAGGSHEPRRAEAARLRTAGTGR